MLEDKSISALLAKMLGRRFPSFLGFTITALVPMIEDWLCVMQ